MGFYYLGEPVFFCYLGAPGNLISECELVYIYVVDTFFELKIMQCTSMFAVRFFFYEITINNLKINYFYNNISFSYYEYYILI